MSSYNSYGHISERGGVERKSNNVKKICIGGIVAILLVAAVVGVITHVSSAKQKISGPAADDTTASDAGVTPGGSTLLPKPFQMGNVNPDMSPTLQDIKTLCDTTDYHDSCFSTLQKIKANNQDAKPADYFHGILEATVDRLATAFNLTADLTKAANDSMNHGALSDCNELLQYAVDELHDVMSAAKESEKVVQRSDDFNNWLSAVISYQETCVDGIIDPNLQSAMKKGLVESKELTSNALALVTAMAAVINAYSNLPFPKEDAKSNSRRLLADDAHRMDAQGYPSWFSAGDRKLMALHAARKMRPNVIVAKDGSGQFKKISDALAAMPKKHRGRYVIYVKAGVYAEEVMVDKDMVNVLMYGDGNRKTVVTGGKNFVDGVQTFKTATFAAIGDGFVAMDMGFRNTAGPEKHQAVAIRVQSDRSVFFRCRFDGYQDTLYAQTHRQFYRNCVISGTIDFIFGDSAAVFQKCLIIVRKPMDNQQNTVTAHGRTEKRETTGLVIQDCRILPERKLYPMRLKIPTYLGRPWKQYSRTVVMDTLLGDFIHPDGWMPWDGDFALKTLVYAEYQNRGPGAALKGRVKWPGYKVIKTRKEAYQYTVGAFIQGAQWLGASGAKYYLGMRT